MSLISLVVTIAIVGLIVWVITALIPMPEQFKKAIYVVSVVFLAIYLLQAFGVYHFHDIKLGK